MRRIKAEKGFSMIEILVALVILAIGLLGMATLMINSLQTSQSAAWRSAATLAAYDLAERIRSNTGDGTESSQPPSYAQPFDTASHVAGEGMSNKEVKDYPRCEGTPENIAKCDLKTWAATLDKSVPAARVLITRDEEGGDKIKNYRYCIAIFWEDAVGKDVVFKDNNDKACGQSAKTGEGEKFWSFYEVKVLI